MEELKAGIITKAEAAVAGPGLLRETDDEAVHWRNTEQFAYEGGRDLMNTLQTMDTAAAPTARALAIEWHIDPPVVIAVREQCLGAKHPILKLVRYVKLAFGVFDHRPSGGITRLHRNHRLRRLDR